MTLDERYRNRKVRIQLLPRVIDGDFDISVRRVRMGDTPQLSRGPVFWVTEKDARRIMVAQEKWEMGRDDPWYNCMGDLEPHIPKVLIELWDRKESAEQ